VAGDLRKDLVSQLEEHRAFIDRREASSAAERTKKARYDQLWAAAVSRKGSLLIRSFLELGTELKERGHGFWLAYRRVDVLQAYKSAGDPPPPFTTQSVLDLLAVELIEAGCNGESKRLENLLNGARKNQFDASDALDTLMGIVRSWGDSKSYPPTPLMSRQDLITACAAANVRGVSAANLCRDIKSGRVVATDQIRGTARFRYKDPDRQLAVLQAAVRSLDPS
jgi:hypothetical protein